MITAIEKTACTGCQTCMEICPVQAISFSDSANGFLRPFLNEKLCVHCGLCLSACPAWEDFAIQFHPTLEAYAGCGKNDNLTQESASGGAFIVMANEVIQRGGAVFGAVLTSDFIVMHKSSEETMLSAMQGSKYVQSEIHHAFQNAAALLTTGRQVLFSGTPCQIMGLLSYLTQKKISMKKLLTVDLICHGVPSAAIFRSYKNHLETVYNKQITEIRFRNKQSHERSGYMMKICFADRSVKWVFHSLDLYYRAFLRGYLYRESCYQCPYAQPNRVGDITIGDCNTYYDYLSVWPDKTISDILINTEKGIQFWESVQSQFDYTKLNLQKERHGNSQLQHPSIKPSDYDFVLRCFQQGEYQKAQKNTGLSLSIAKKVKMQIKAHISWKLAEKFIQ